MRQNPNATSTTNGLILLITSVKNGGITDKMIRRYVSHIPARHFKMIRYYGFLANRKRGRLLPKVYDALDTNHPNVPEKPGFAALIKGFLNTDLYQCILCGNRLRFMSAEKGIHAVT
ncbi:transposase [Providencia sp. Je.9.19]